MPYVKPKQQPLPAPAPQPKAAPQSQATIDPKIEAEPTQSTTTTQQPQQPSDNVWTFDNVNSALGILIAVIGIAIWIKGMLSER